MMMVKRGRTRRTPSFVEEKHVFFSNSSRAVLYTKLPPFMSGMENQ
jgi:hypothetical protein